LCSIKSSNNHTKLHYESLEQSLAFGFIENLKPHELRYEITNTAWSNLGDSEVMAYITPTHPYFKLLEKLIPIIDLYGIHHLQRNLNNIPHNVSNEHREQIKLYSELLKSNQSNLSQKIGETTSNLTEIIKNISFRNRYGKVIEF